MRNAQSGNYAHHGYDSVKASSAGGDRVGVSNKVDVGCIQNGVDVPSFRNDAEWT